MPASLASRKACSCILSQPLGGWSGLAGIARYCPKAARVNKPKRRDQVCSLSGARTSPIILRRTLASLMRENARLSSSPSEEDMKSKI